MLGKVRIDKNFEMGYEIDDFTDPWKKSDTIILQHGNHRPRQFWYAWVPVLARHLRVIRPHFRGYADSAFEAPPDFRWTIDVFVNDMKRLLDELGLDKVHYVGESSGGIIGYHLAYHHPERLKTLTVCGVGPTLKGHPLIEKKRLIDVLKRDGIAAFHDSMYAQRREWALDLDRMEWQQSVMKKWPLSAALGILQADCVDINVEDFLSKINVPTLLLVGAEWTLTITVQEFERIRSLMPRAKLVTFPGVKGVAQFEVPEKCAEEVLRFIKEQEREQA